MDIRGRECLVRLSKTYHTYYIGGNDFIGYLPQVRGLTHLEPLTLRMITNDKIMLYLYNCILLKLCGLGSFAFQEETLIECIVLDSERSWSSICV